MYNCPCFLCCCCCCFCYCCCLWSKWGVSVTLFNCSPQLFTTLNIIFTHKYMLVPLYISIYVYVLFVVFLFFSIFKLNCLISECLFGSVICIGRSTSQAKTVCRGQYFPFQAVNKPTKLNKIYNRNACRISWCSVLFL